MRCDTIAEGVIAAAREVKLAVPLVVRMKGTNEELGRKLLAESGLPIISADNMADAAQKIVAAVGRKIGSKDHEHPDRPEHPGHDPGHHRQDRRVSHPAVPRLRQRQGVLRRRRQPNKAGENFEGIPIFGNVARRRSDRRDRVGHLRAAAVRGRRHRRGGGCRARPRDLHHRRRAGARHDRDPLSHARQEDAAGRARTAPA